MYIQTYPQRPLEDFESRSISRDQIKFTSKLILKSSNSREIALLAWQTSVLLAVLSPGPVRLHIVLKARFFKKRARSNLLLGGLRTQQLPYSVFKIKEFFQKRTKNYQNSEYTFLLNCLQKRYLSKKNNVFYKLNTPIYIFYDMSLNK